MAKKATAEISVKIRESKAEVKMRIDKAISKTLKKAAAKSKNQMQMQLRTIVSEAIKNSATYQSILNGRLKIELGIPDGHNKLDDIMTEWINSIVVDVNTSGMSKSFLIRVQGIDASYRDVLGVSGATQSTEKGESLEWLRWLLLEGSNIIIMDFEIGDGQGRAGSNIMIERRRGGWKVPEQFQGVAQDNFITKALRESQSQIKAVIRNNFIKSVK